jgi:ATP-dependent Clp protease adaptor protein ClpS
MPWLGLPLETALPVTHLQAGGSPVTSPAQSTLVGRAEVGSAPSTARSVIAMTENRIDQGVMNKQQSTPRLMANKPRPRAPGPGNGNDQDGRTGLVTKTRPKTKKPSLYKVLLLNDDYTPMEFVIHVLEKYFNKSREEATRIMLHVHQKGVGVCGVFTYEVAETKVTQVMDVARQNGHPLQCTMEKE